MWNNDYHSFVFLDSIPEDFKVRIWNHHCFYSMWTDFVTLICKRVLLTDNLKRFTNINIAGCCNNNAHFNLHKWWDVQWLLILHWKKSKCIKSQVFGDQLMVTFLEILQREHQIFANGTSSLTLINFLILFVKVASLL